ncbi:LysR family transcriptional regulator [Chitiniphilus purpureus]|uniref:LysR family transcriptional regulator n=1 Tax=Chitiniphilus purpureus TaxID=2981137 RepID=A0ABY6DSJ9_9NEIS|nr:LysR family transcriptional regulator [Chitiniphilus sp. CD1]UXY17208.1 LysR family transcriptional regulator [Chitiniphilus sp. CD1]
MRNLQGLVSFVEAARAGSFSAAAHKLGVSPAAVSKNVLRLEQQLQVRLFTRSTRRLVLTPEGSAFLGKAGAALAMLDEAVLEAAQTAQEPIGRVRISAGISFGRTFVLPLLPALATRHPRLEVELHLDNRPTDLAAEGFDLGLRGGVLADSGLIARRICPLHSVLVASPGYLHRFGIPRRPEDLQQHRLLGVRFTSGHTAPWHFRSRHDDPPLEFSPDAQIWSSDPDALKDMAAMDAGIAQAGLLHAAPLLRSGQLKVLLHDDYDHGAREMALCYPHRKLLSPRVKAVIDALLTHFQAQPDLQLTAHTMPPAWRAD